MKCEIKSIKGDRDSDFLCFSKIMLGLWFFYTVKCAHFWEAEAAFKSTVVWWVRRSFGASSKLINHCTPYWLLTRAGSLSCQCLGLQAQGPVSGGCKPGGGQGRPSLGRAAPWVLLSSWQVPHRRRKAAGRWNDTVKKLHNLYRRSHTRVRHLFRCPEEGL